ncbi:Glyoxalase/Bleomycin resistance protein/Dihydroxybiphenyl dioxygenase [Xylogone sp. PMI_703]|nr:Glyoxalase/Bleomycin resistance protein/Dihydroxybiphenyl dioxygenase [Xylogone sp. PMI_703]
MADGKIRVLRLAHVHYQHPDLDKALSFLSDFGMIEEKRVDGRVYLRGYGVQPFLYVAEQSPDNKKHFKGGYWVVDTEADLQKAAAHPKASKIEQSTAPGGGKVVTIEDPNSFIIGFVFGQTLRDADTESATLEEASSGHHWNGPDSKQRRGNTRRFQKGPCPVHKLGHYGFIVPRSRVKATLDWYTNLINIQRSDTMYNPVTGEDEGVFNHIDLGKTYTDHHSLFVAGGPEEDAPFVHHSSFEVNDIDTQTIGHNWLARKGWTNCWGIGRHILGSQIFDYW